LALALDGDVAALIGRQDLASAVDNGHLPAWGCLAKGPWLDRVPLQAWEIDDQHANLGRAVHTARRHPKCPLNIGKRVGIHRLTGIRNFLKMEAIAVVQLGVFEQAEHGWGCGHVGNLELLKRLEHTPGLELAGVTRDMNPERQRGNRPMPETM